MRILIVDDSIVFRSSIKAALDGMSNFEIVGSASNGKIALSKLEGAPVDLVTLDLEMPVMNGLEALRELRKRDTKTRVIVFSSQTTKGSEKAIEALQEGADDFVAKPTGEDLNIESATDRIREELVPKILQFASRGARVSAVVAKPEAAPKKEEPEMTLEVPLPQSYPKVDVNNFQPLAVVIGSSTGGPAALDTLFRGIEGPLRCPIFITQHMPPVFTASLAKRLSAHFDLEIAEAKDGEVVENNRVYIAPGDYHMRVAGKRDAAIIKLDQGPKVHAVRPAVDLLFESAAKVYKENLMGFVLTGMGDDGGIGATHIKSNHGGMMIQDKESCVVFGMPAAVARMEAFDQMGNLDKILTVLKRMTKGAG